MPADRERLLELAARCEAAEGPTKALDREIALAVGWVRQTPGEAGRKHPAWFHPDDCRDGRVVLDSLHGTDVWRDPLTYTASLDAALTLVPEGARDEWIVKTNLGQPRAIVWLPLRTVGFDAAAATPALALCAASLRARAQENSDG